MNDGLPEFFRYHLWANLRLLDACRYWSDTHPMRTRSDLAGVHAVWIRLLADEEKYVGALTGQLPAVPLDEYVAVPKYAELRRRAERTGEELIMVAEQDELDHVLHLDGEPFDAPAGIVLLQAFQHALDLRTQIVLELRSHQLEPPNLDGWSYHDTLHAAA
ncbi:MAG TPA: damage-inducible protein DinB [Ktedonobacterales bacterium]|jgi:uncharacterized damage-inducible protein DinB